jgi:hypothetical protein
MAKTTARRDVWRTLWAIFCDGSAVGVRRTKAEASRVHRLFKQNHLNEVHVEGPYVLKDGGR